MRKYFLSLVALATILLSAACSKVENPYISENGEMVTFNIAAPEMGTRAYSDGLTANKLTVAVYNQAGEHLAALRQDVSINGSTTVQLPLVTGVTYDIVFWAYAEGAPYTFNADNHTVTLNDTDKKANNEKRDAFFFGWDDYTVSGPKTELVELTRPFAQLNVATLDYTTAVNAGVEITTTDIKVEGVYNSFDLLNGNVLGTAQTITLEQAATPKAASQKLKGYETYDWLSMNYLLVNEKTTVTATMNTNNTNVTRQWFSIPLQRNYRTNILGNILTTTTDFNVVIEEGFKGDNTVENVAEGIRLVNGVYEIYSANGFAYAAKELFNTEKDGQYKLTSDIDWNDVTLTKSSLDYPYINITHKVSTFNFDGQGYTIKNLPNCFISYTGSAKEVIVVNLTLDGSKINIPDTGTNGIGAFIGYAGTSSTITLSNCHVVNAVIEGGHWNGGLIGYAAGYNAANNGPVFETVTIEQCSVTNSQIKGDDTSVGGIIGHATGDLATKVIMDNITVVGNTILTNKDNKGGSVVGTVGAAGPVAWNGQKGGTYISNYLVEDNTVKCNGNTNNKLWGRQGSNGGELYINGVLVTDWDTYEEPVSTFTEENGVYTFEVITSSAVTDVLEHAATNYPNSPITISMDDTQSISWATGPAGAGANSFNHGASVTIQGGTFIATGSGAFKAEAPQVEFKDVEIVDNTKYLSENGETAWEFCYLEFTGNVKFENCIFNNTVAFEGENGEFINCTFKGNTTNPSNVGQEYDLWIGNGVVKLENCKIEGPYRGIKMHEAYGSEIKEVVIDGCTFGPISKKPGLAIGTLNADTKVVVKNSTFNNCQAGDQGLYIYETDTDVNTFLFELENNTLNITLNEDYTIGTTGEISKAVVLKGLGLSSLTIDGQNLYKINFTGETQYESGNFEQSPSIITDSKVITIKNTTVVNTKHSYKREEGNYSAGSRFPVYAFVRGEKVVYDNVVFKGSVVTYDPTQFVDCSLYVEYSNHFALFADNQYGGYPINVEMERCHIEANGSYGCIRVADDKSEGGAFTVKNSTYINNSNTTDWVDAVGSVNVTLENNSEL